MRYLILAFLVGGCGDEASEVIADAAEAPVDTAVLEDAVEGAEGTTLDYPVDATGPFHVGYVTFPYDYEALGSARTIDIHLWYPTKGTGGESPIYEGLFLDEVSQVNAALAPPVGATYPVHVHSHGHMGFGGSSANLAQYFASHGWMVVAPDHTGNTLTDNIDPRPASTYLTRSLDVSAALDALEAHEPTADTDRVLMSGHSFGVHTCWASAGATFDIEAVKLKLTEATADELIAFEAGVVETRVVASIPMAGSIDRDLFGAGGHTSVSIPMLAMSGGLDPVGADEQFDTTDAVDLTWIDLAGGCHQTFALGDCETLEPEQGFAIVNLYALAFARTHVLSDTDEAVLGIVDGTMPVSAKVTFKKKEP